jgi:hypothetical protein
LNKNGTVIVPGSKVSFAFIAEAENIREQPIKRRGCSTFFSGGSGSGGNGTAHRLLATQTAVRGIPSDTACPLQNIDMGYLINNMEII